MASYFKRNGQYGVQMITGPRLIILLLELLPERIDDPEVHAISTEYPYRNPDVATVQTRVLEGTDAANQEHGTAFHPWSIKFAVEDFSDACNLLRHAAHSIVDRLADQGENGYEKEWV